MDALERDAALKEASALLTTDPKLAQRWAMEILIAAPNDVRAALILGSARRRNGDPAGACAILAPLAASQANSPFAHCELGLSLAALGQAEAAVAALRRAIALQDILPEAWWALADQLAALGREDEAEAMLAERVKANPTAFAARLNYALVLIRRQKSAEAIVELERLSAAAPGDANLRVLLAACLVLVGEIDRAIETYRGVLAESPDETRTWLAYGHALKAAGQREAATRAYARAAALNPGFGEAYWSLANLKTVPFSAAEAAAIRIQLSRADLNAEDRLHLHYALGKALEDRGEAAGSFAHYAEGAALRRSQARHDAEAAQAAVLRTKAVCNPTLFAARAGSGDPSDAPIFVVGLPRSGSTLIEQILASHSEVEGTAELPELIAIARDLGRTADYPEVLATLDADQLRALGERYLGRTRVHRRLGKPRFVDKMPNNFHHIGLIQLVLPNAMIIDARRHPMATCFSAYKQLFARGHSWSYDLADLGAYYRDYLELMAHFDEVLPGKVCRVIHEDLVADTEGEVRRLLEACGLPFEAACLRPWETERVVRTASSEQVRRPIFTDGLEQWRSYESQLEPLKTALGPALETWRG